jgi:hypothetical protein
MSKRKRRSRRDPAQKTAANSAAEARTPAAALDLKVGRDFNQMRIHEVVEYVAEHTGVKVRLDIKSLWYDQGTTRNVPVTLQAKDLTVREFLDQVVGKQLKAAYVVRDDVIVITSRKAAKKAPQEVE